MEKIGHRVKGKDYSGRPWDEIRRRYETGQAGPGALAELYNIPETTIRNRATRKRWTRNKNITVIKADNESIENINKNIENINTGSGKVRVNINKGVSKLWHDQKIDRLLEDLGDWVDSWQGNDTGVTLQDFCLSRHNSQQVRATQITYLFDNERFQKGMERLRPLVADRIATLTWTLKGGKSAPLGIFWLKQFGWTDRQEIKVEHSGQSLESAISRAYDVTPQKLD